MTKEEILKVLNDHKETAKFGSDGDYQTYQAVYEEEFSEVADAILRLSEVSRSAKVKINEPFEVEEMGDRFEAIINNYIDDNGLWDKKTVIVKVD